MTLFNHTLDRFKLPVEDRQKKNFVRRVARSRSAATISKKIREAMFLASLTDCRTSTAHV